MTYYQSPFGSPRQQAPPPLSRNYAEIFDPKDYECKSDLELESYARNLSNYLDKLLKDQPFPAFLFEKLETRFNGILSMLKSRSAAKGVSTTKHSAQERLKRLNASLDALSSTQPASPDDDVEDHRPLKKVRTFQFNEEIRQEMKEEKKRKRSLFPSTKDEEEEEDEA